MTRDIIINCPTCQLDIAGNHAYNCPNSPQRQIIDVDFDTPFSGDIFKDLENLKRHNIVCRTAAGSETGHYVSYNDVLELFRKYWGK